MMGASVQQPHTKFPLQPLDLLAERGLNNVLTRCSPAKVKLLSKRHEKLDLTELHNTPYGLGLPSVCNPDTGTPRLGCLALAAAAWPHQRGHIFLILRYRRTSGHDITTSSPKAALVTPKVTTVICPSVRMAYLLFRLIHVSSRIWISGSQRRTFSETRQVR